jgi:protease I
VRKPHRDKGASSLKPPTRRRTKGGPSRGHGRPGAERQTRTAKISLKLKRKPVAPVNSDNPQIEETRAMAMKAEGKTMAILAADGFEEAELFSPKGAIEAAGGRVEVISLKAGDIQGLRHMERGRSIHVDKTVGDAKPDDYDAILIPGGVFSPDALRTNERALRFACAFVNQRKPVFAICHGPQVLISAGAAKDRRMTGVKAIQRDLENAGANVKDEAVVVDDGLVTSRTPDDLDAFNEMMVHEIAEASQDRHPNHFGFAFF